MPGLPASATESIEIKGEPDQYDTKDVRALLASYGLKCWGAVTLTLAERNLCAKNDQATRRVGRLHEERRHDGQGARRHGDHDRAEHGRQDRPGWHTRRGMDVGVESLKEIHEHANKSGVVIAIEPLNRFETHFITRGEQALALADAVAPDVGVCLDCFHMNIEEVDLLETIRTIGPRLNDFHLADNNRMACGMGSLDWPAIVGALRDINYDGALTVEFVAPVDRTPANKYPDAVETAPVDISPEELQFIIDHGSSLLSEEFYGMLVEKCATTILPLIQ